MKTKDLIKEGKQYLYQLNSANKALGCFTEAIKIDNINLEAHIHKATTLIDLHHSHRALEFVNMAMKINPHYVDTYFVKSRALTELGDIEEAINYYEYGANFYVQYERNAESYFVQGAALKAILDNKDFPKDIEIKMQETVISCYNSALKIDRNFGAAYIAKSQTLIEMEKYKEAIKCCTDGLKFKAYHSELYSDMGRSLYALENYKEALSYFDICIQIAPREAKYNYYQGLCLNKTGKFKEAIVSFNKYINLKSKEAAMPDEEELAILCSLTEEREYAAEWARLEYGDIPDDVSEVQVVGAVYGE